jgi:hypothetical protein
VQFLFADRLHYFNLFSSKESLVASILAGCSPEVRPRRVRELRAPRVASDGLTFLEAAKRCRTPERVCDFNPESFFRFPTSGLSIERANLRQYAATSASSERKVLILPCPRSRPIV